GEDDDVAATTGGTTVNHTYDSADRMVDSGYVYDDFGRTTAAPGGTSISYYANDMVYQQTSGAQRQTWQLDAGQRIRSWTAESNASGAWAQTGSKVNHYANDNDSPRWLVEDPTAGTLTRFVGGADGVVGATTSKTGDTTLYLTNIHGDVNLILPLDTTKSSTVLDADEFGKPKAVTSSRYGWLGGFQRSTETPTGLTLMGARLYDPNVGRFLSVDPQYGGNANSYEYGFGDPVNRVDLDGRWSWTRTKFFSWGRVWARMFTAGWGSSYGYIMAQATFTPRWTGRVADYSGFIYGPAGAIAALFGPAGAAIGVAIGVIGAAAQGAATWARNTHMCLAINASADLVVGRWTQIPYYAPNAAAFP
ncbi:RHS repeat-associated core domain-containing protein, partial [Kitasatospora sp. NPDC093558]|uniref:RHS repeat-associated core domain-containing protein n=1 Tax=Kitasatospora sp. NPDC093558 TaxID=3155201 RepID=UPI003436C76C